MKLIPLEEVIKVLNRLDYYFDSDWAYKHMESILHSLPTIDPIATIDEMIEDLLGKWGSIPEIAKNTHQVEVLQALKSRLSLIK